MTPDSFRIDSYATSPLTPSTDRALDQAMLRAYSIERAADYGCSLEDILKLQRRVGAGHSWVDVTLQLANDNELRASRALHSGQKQLASMFLRHAAACCRLAQAGLEHDPSQRLSVYERQARNFHGAMEATPGGDAEYFEVTHGDAQHASWLFRARGFNAGGGVVLIWGGADGWCEAFHESVPFYLEHDLSVCLLELPGQGLARLRHGSTLRPDFTQMVSATLNELTARGAAENRFGIVGHSAGGSLALAAAAADDRIKACCSNGGSPYLEQGLRKYPRVLQRFGRMLGESTSETEVLEFFKHIDLPQASRRMDASLLCIQGGQDPLVSDSEASQLIDLRGKPAARMAYWPEGTHCVYNHALERNCVISDWLDTQLNSNKNLG